MNPVDDSIAPDYSKVISKPMCFLRMREKIQAGQYPSWLSFVEDFQCICQNAMKYNQKRSKIWNAANLLLRQGKKCLEQQYLRYGKILGINRVHTGSHLQEVAAKRKLDVNCEGTQLNAVSKNHNDKVSNVTSSENLVSSLCMEQSAAICEKHPRLRESVVRVHSAVSPISKPLTKSSDEDVHVEILTHEPEEIARMDLDSQATECSSSFSGTCSEGDDCEEQSRIRSGNGAGIAMEDTTATSRRKRPMDADWKVYRRGIEWRCRWLELRLEELQAEARKYKRVYEAAETRKQRQYLKDNTEARTSIMRPEHSIHVLRRKRRRREEEGCDLKANMAKHPLFSRYEKKKHWNQELSSTEEGARDDKEQILEFDDLSFDFDDVYEDNIVVENDSIEHHLWQIEALQMHIVGLQNQLSRGPAVQEFDDSTQISAWDSPRNFGGVTPPVHSPCELGTRSAAVRGSKGQGTTPSSRRRNSDFDINNVVMPDSVMASYVEPARHVFITTPQWRQQKSLASQDEEGSSEENTDDEIYTARHARMLVQERQQQYKPLSLNRSRSISLAKERPKIEVSKTGLAMDSIINKEEFDGDQTHLTDFGTIPKKKRRKRESREVAGAVAADGQLILNTFLQGENPKGRTRSSLSISRT